MAATKKPQAKEAAPAGAEGGPPAESGVTHIRVAARARDGFRRCGRAWPLAPVDVPVSEFSAAEIERLLEEPALIADILAPDA